MAGIFSLRNWVMKQLMKPDKSGIMKIPPKGKVDFGEMLLREQLFQKGIDPKMIKNEKQLDNIINTPAVPKSERVKPKKSGKVIEVDFDKGRWNKAQGGRTGLSYLLAEDTNERMPLEKGGASTQEELNQYLKDREKRDREEKRKKFEKDFEDWKKWQDTQGGTMDFAAEGGRIGYAGGGMGRRAFLKLMSALGLTGVGAKYGLAGLLKGGKKQVAKELTQVPIKNIEGMPSWFKPLVNKVIREGEQVSSHGDRIITYKTKLPKSKTDVYVEQDLNTGDVMVDLGITKHGFPDGHLGQPVRLQYKAPEWIEPTIKKGKSTKGTKTKEEFWVEEAEFTGGHPENVKFEESTINKFGEHGSNFDEVEKFATGKIKKKTAKESIKAERAHWTPEGDYASGGRVPLGKGKIVKGIMSLGKKKKKKLTADDVSQDHPLRRKEFEEELFGTKEQQESKKFKEKLIKKLKQYHMLKYMDTKGKKGHAFGGLARMLGE